MDGTQQWLIKPYRRFVGTDFPYQSQKDNFRMEWKPIFSKMMEAPGLKIPVKLELIDESFVQESYKLATEFLKSAYSYIFDAPASCTSSYTIGTWSYKIKRSVVRQQGNQADIDQLPGFTPRNKRRYNKTHVHRKPRRKIRLVQRRNERKVHRGGNTGDD